MSRKAVHIKRTGKDPGVGAFQFLYDFRRDIVMMQRYFEDIRFTAGIFRSLCRFQNAAFQICQKDFAGAVLVFGASVQ